MTDDYHCSGYCLECGRKLVWAGTHWGRHSAGQHAFWRQHLLTVIARLLRKLAGCPDYDCCSCQCHACRRDCHDYCSHLQGCHMGCKPRCKP